MGVIKAILKPLLLAYSVQFLSFLILTTIVVLSVNHSPKIQSIFGYDQNSVADFSLTPAQDRGQLGHPADPDPDSADPSPFSRLSDQSMDDLDRQDVKRSAEHQFSTNRILPRAAPYEIKSCLSPDLQVHEEATCRFFAVMFDGGSTGTRIHIFEFSHDISRKTPAFKLEREVYSEVSPGLSSYLNNPQEAAKSIIPLLKKAKSTIAKSQWMHTPIALKATAGLRLLNLDKAEKILNEVDRLFDNSGFLTNEESVSIMTGVDEGIFGWFTLNFLLDRLEALKQPVDQFFNENNASASTAAALDLGGGSTQITFRPRKQGTLIEAPEEFIKEIRLYGQTVNIYTHSYLGNGLVASRLASLKLTNPRPTVENHFSTSCLPTNTTVHWVYNDVIYTVSGANRTYHYDGCLAEQEVFIAKSAIDRPRELSSRDIYLFGYFYDRAHQSGLTERKGQRVTLAHFERAARKACFRRRLGEEDYERWLCRDLVYITLLLKSYGIPDDKQLHLTKKLRNMEVSWALGASYHLLNTYHESRKAGRILTNRPDGSSFIGPRKPANDARDSSFFQNATPSGGGPCDDFRVDEKRAVGGVLDNVLLNFGAFYVCSRVYHGLFSLLPYLQQLA